MGGDATSGLFGCASKKLFSNWYKGPACIKPKFGFRYLYMSNF